MVDSPFQRSKDNSCLCDIADLAEADPVAKENGERNESGEPEEHGECFSAEDAELVVHGAVGHLPRNHAEVSHRENGEDRREDEEVDFGGRHVVPIAIPPI